MSEETQSTPSHHRDATFPLALGLVLLLLLGLVILPLAQARFGLWEPWETTWAEIARAMRESGEWFNPQLGGKSAPRSLLSVWLIALAQAVGGGSEWIMRYPMAATITAGSVALLAWLREPFGNWRGFIAALAALTCPQVVLSATTLAGEGVFVGLFMATIALYGLLVGRPDDRRPIALQLLLGVLTALMVLAWGLWGLYLPAAIVAALGLTQLAHNPTLETPRAVLVGTGVGAVAVIAALVGWGFWQEWNPKANQILMAIKAAVPNGRTSADTAPTRPRARSA
ncbi:MAG: glycosyltransferase family 39 protein, partial [Myxococcota bacterium]